MMSVLIHTPILYYQAKKEFTQLPVDRRNRSTVKSLLFCRNKRNSHYIFYITDSFDNVDSLWMLWSKKWNFTQWMLIFLYGNPAFIYNVCNRERTITKFLNLCPILLININKICSIQFKKWDSFVNPRILIGH